MSNRITIKTLQQNVDMLNRMTGNLAEPYRKNENGGYSANIGNYHISQAYGGYALHQMVSAGGGVRDIFNRGHMPARELHGLIWAYVRGLEQAAA
jgi:hypothetical protein